MQIRPYNRWLVLKTYQLTEEAIGLTDGLFLASGGLQGAGQSSLR